MAEVPERVQESRGQQRMYTEAQRVIRHCLGELFGLILSGGITREELRDFIGQAKGRTDIRPSQIELVRLRTQPYVGVLRTLAVAIIKGRITPLQLDRFVTRPNLSGALTDGSNSGTVDAMLTLIGLSEAQRVFFLNAVISDEEIKSNLLPKQQAVGVVYVVRANYTRSGARGHALYFNPFPSRLWLMGRSEEHNGTPLRFRAFPDQHFIDQHGVPQRYMLAGKLFGQPELPQPAHMMLHRWLGLGPGSKPQIDLMRRLVIVTAKDERHICEYVHPEPAKKGDAKPAKV